MFIWVKTKVSEKQKFPLLWRQEADEAQRRVRHMDSFGLCAPINRIRGLGGRILSVLCLGMRALNLSLKPFKSNFMWWRKKKSYSFFKKKKKKGLQKIDLEM